MSKQEEETCSPSLCGPPLKTCQWLPISLRVDAEVPTMDSKVQHNLPHFLYPLTSLDSFVTLFLPCPLFSSYDRSPWLSLNMPSLFLPQWLCPFLCLYQSSPMYLTKLSHLLPSGSRKVYLLRMPSLTIPLKTATLPDAPDIPISTSCFFFLHCTYCPRTC